MTLSDLAVRRPVFAAVFAILLCVIGFAAYFTITVRELPNVDPPVVSVSTVYTGASAEVIEERITEVIERQVSGIQGIDRIYSSSRDGRSNINIVFTLDRPLEAAANDVRDAVSRATGRLPVDAEAPVVIKANADAQPLISLGLSSTTMNRLELSDYANRYLVERLSTVPGVAQIFVAGSQDYAMRIWLDPAAMAARNVTVQDVESALNNENIELPAGNLESTNKDYVIRVGRNYSTPAQFATLPITPAKVAADPSSALRPVGSAVGTGNYVVRLGDIAQIREEAAEPRRFFQRNGHDGVNINLVRQSQANDLDISAAVHKALKEIQPGLPKGMKLEVMVDYTVFTSRAIKEVWITMAISLALVAAVNFVFLGSWRAAVIPSIVAPICILSTFIVLAPLNFSINLLTLLALVLAIGLVVDDAIVVVENIQRRIDMGEPPVIAAERGAKQVFFAVVATTVVLISVFMPLMFLPGYIGRLFVELAVAIAAAVGFSALLALSLSPMLSSKLLRPAQSEGWLARKVDSAMGLLRDSYRASLEMILGKPASVVAVGLGVVVLTAAAAGVYTVLPKEVVPSEDRGRIDIMVSAPDGAGYEYTLAQTKKALPILNDVLRKGLADDWLMVVPQGFGGNISYSTGNGALVLHDWDSRKVSADQITADLNRRFASITGARVIAAVRGPFQRGGGGTSGGQSVDFIASGAEYEQVAAWMRPILADALANPGLSRARLDYEPTSPRLIVSIDRDKAAALGVSTQAIGQALQTMFGSHQVTTYIRNGREYDVILQTALESRSKDEDLNKLYVRTATGETVPLATVVKTEVRGDTDNRPRVDRLRAITLTAQLNPGYSIGQAIDFFKAEAAKQPNNGVVVSWGGNAKDYLEASGAVGLAFGLALLLVFLVLAAQFESFIHPAVIMTTVPLAVLGGLFALLMAGSSLNTYSQIGLIILVGISAKNGILIVEFANQLRDQGRTVREAVIEGASLRLRPIIMTSIAAAFGALPLVLASGPGAASRRTIGVVIFAGAIVSSLLTLFVAPVFYNVLARYTKSPDHTARIIEAFDANEGEPGLKGLAP